MRGHSYQGKGFGRELWCAGRAYLERITGGPDVTNNGIALSATVHWLFDSYLISFSEDFRLLIDERRVPKELHELLTRYGGTIALPTDRKIWPHPAYLEKHRATFLDSVNDKSD